MPPPGGVPKPKTMTPVKGSTDSTDVKSSTSSEAFQMWRFTPDGDVRVRLSGEQVEDGPARRVEGRAAVAAEGFTLEFVDHLLRRDLVVAGAEGRNRGGDKQQSP